jgi:hypothetical protein
VSFVLCVAGISLGATSIEIASQTGTGLMATLPDGGHPLSWWTYVRPDGKANQSPRGKDVDPDGPHPKGDMEKFHSIQGLKI